MSSPELPVLLGLPTFVDVRRVEADHVLLALSLGPYVDRTCGPEPTDTGVSWLHVATLPPPSMEFPNPFEALLNSLVGGQVCLRFRIFHQEGGMGLFLGSADAALLSQTRSLLSPGVDTTPVPSAPPPLRLRSGLVFRLQAELDAPGRKTAVRMAPLERLASVAGTWVVDLELRSVDAIALLMARRSAEALADLASGRLSTTQQVTSGQTRTASSAPWQRVLDWLEVSQQHLTEAGSDGGWGTSTWVSAADQTTLQRTLAALRGGPQVGGRRFIAYDLASVDTGGQPASFLTSGDLAGLLTAPTRAVPGLMIRKAPPGHRRPRVNNEPVPLGRYPNSEEPARLSLDDLAGHAFVTGTTGSGKTTTLHRLLAEVWNRYRVPFLVIDPVKDDYSAVAGLFGGGLTVITGRELRLNLMAAWPGEDPVTHLAQVAQAFRGSFTMPSPTPYVVTQLFDRLALQPGGPVGADLHDLRDLLNSLVGSLGYAPEAHSNIRAALGTRLDTLLSPARAHRFCWPDSGMVDSMFDRPTVVTLSDLVDDEERSFVVLLLALATWAKARGRTAPKEVSHLLVLEEAHRVIPEVSPNDNPELGSARRASAGLLSAMLAEVRAFGEQVIVVDQSPGRVSADVLRNTNLKIAHRIVHPEDQMAIAGAIGIAVEDADLLGLLERGQALISTRSEPLPQTIQVIPLQSDGKVPIRPQSAGSPWPCGCQEPRAHFRAWQVASRAGGPLALFILGCRGGTVDLGLLRDEVSRELALVGSAVQAPVGCLAWAGIRRVLGQERELGIIETAAGFQAALDGLHMDWLLATDTQSVPGQDPGDLRAVIDARYHVGVRTPLSAFGRDDWGSAVSSMRDWLLRERAELGHWVSDRGARAVLAGLVAREAERGGLGPGEAGVVLRRAQLI